jgi:hypothetical protein
MFPVGFTTPAAQVIVMTLVSVCFQVLQVYLQPWRPLANLIDAVLSTPPSVLRALQLPEGQGMATSHLRVPLSVLRALRLPKGQGVATGHLRVPPSVLRALRMQKGQGVATGHLRVPPSGPAKNCTSLTDLSLFACRQVTD